ncbi:MAG: SDR family NAD(P)-dependent oxidoreductase, partial [Afipia sp.]|nr:SDR family NAD(P)-dependent oxidoreductase [Afipia sp.]
MDSGLRGKVVFITGGANGIGRATALAFAREGATVGVLDLDQVQLQDVAKEIAAINGKAVVAKADLSSGDGVKAGLDELLAATGGAVDVLVNNVGSGAIRTFDQLTDEEWDKTF